MSDEQMDMDIQEEFYEDNYNDADDFDDYDLEDLAKKQSAPSRYQICSADKISVKIDKDIEKVSEVTAFSKSWSELLFAKCFWQMQTIHSLLIKQTNLKQIVFYVEGYVMKKDQNTTLCEVCYQKKHLLANSCGHKFCLQCWTYLLDTSISANSELYPNCQAQNCSHMMSFEIIQEIFRSPHNSALMKNYQRLRVLLYSKYNESVKVCSNHKCEQKFLINDVSIDPLICKCRAFTCAFCGSEYHYPINCVQNENWKMINKEMEKKWIEIVQYKICPQCKEPIEKNQGCNHITCRCKHQFCWICLNDWKTHGVCFGIKAHEKMEQERKKMLLKGKQYRQKFQEAKEADQRLSHIQERIEGIKDQQLKSGLMRELYLPYHELGIFSEIKQTVKLGIHFCKCFALYSFFRPQIDQMLIIYSKRVYEEVDELNTYLTQLNDNFNFFESVLELQIREQLMEKIVGLISTQKRKEMTEKNSRAAEFIMKVLNRK